MKYQDIINSHIKYGISKDSINLDNIDCILPNKYKEDLWIKYYY